jgi:hypothetical protein
MHEVVTRCKAFCVCTLCSIAFLTRVCICLLLLALALLLLLLQLSVHQQRKVKQRVPVNRHPASRKSQQWQQAGSSRRE